MLLMLEDDDDRIGRFRATLAAIDPTLRLVVWRDARAMIRALEEFLPRARLISLDHDLEPIPGEGADPGTGVDVAKFLAARPPSCPVIIHSSNTQRSRWMAGEFELAGWKYKMAPPIGEDWVEQYWRAVVCRLLGKNPGRARSGG
jgi:hypothetical protein